MINIEINDGDALEMLGQVASNNWLRAPMTRGLARLQAGMAIYPPTRPGQRYVRGRGPTNAQGRVISYTSQNLGKRWTSEISESGSGITGRIGNNTTYGPFVQSAEDQAWMHQGRWQTDEEVARQNEDAIRGDFLNTINSLTG